MPRPLCIILGAARGISGGTARVFCREGFDVICVRRSATPEDLDVKAQAEDGARGVVTWRYMDVLDEDAMGRLAGDVAGGGGHLRAVIYNLGCNVGTRSVCPAPHGRFRPSSFTKLLHRGVGGLHLACDTLLPVMLAQAEKEKDGDDIYVGRRFVGVTGATASVRGAPGQAFHAAAMHARRGFAASLAGEVGEKGVHVAHVIVDGAVDAPDTIGKLMNKVTGDADAFQKFAARKRSEDAIVLPEDAGDAYWYLFMQRRSAWTFEMDIRPWSDRPWWAGKL